MAPGAEGTSEKRERSAERLIAIGASAGGVEALTRLVAELPAGLPASVVVVLHLSAEVPSHLAYILAKVGTLPTADAHDGDLLLPGRILVALPGHHLLVQDGRARLLDAAPVKGQASHRPPLRVRGPRVRATTCGGHLDGYAPRRECGPHRGPPGGRRGGGTAPERRRAPRDAAERPRYSGCRLLRAAEGDGPVAGEAGAPADEVSAPAVFLRGHDPGAGQLSLGAAPRRPGAGGTGLR
jgi:hypothetical protein